MIKINFKFGDLYIDAWDEWEAAGDGIRIYDSRKRFFDICSHEVNEVFLNDVGEEITSRQFIESVIADIEKISSIEDLLDYLGIDCDLITTDIEKVYKWIDYPNDGKTKKIEDNEWVNFIGDYYIVVSEYNTI